MEQKELKQQLKTLLNENQETFVETLNEIFVEEWLKDQKEELLTFNTFDPKLITLLKSKIEKEIGEKYITPSKFSTLLDTFITVEVIEKGTDEEKIKEFENNPNLLEGIKEIVKSFDKEYGENW